MKLGALQREITELVVCPALFGRNYIVTCDILTQVYMDILRTLHTVAQGEGTKTVEQIEQSFVEIHQKGKKRVKDRKKARKKARKSKKRKMRTISVNKQTSLDTTQVDFVTNESKKRKNQNIHRQKSWFEKR